MGKAKGKGDASSKVSTPPEAAQDNSEARSGNAWIRGDGAICFDNECITLKQEPDGAMALAFDPNKCSCDEANDKILQAIISSAISGKGVRLEIKPKNQSE
jgi:hypothetical protein